MRYVYEVTLKQQGSIVSTLNVAGQDANEAIDRALNKINAKPMEWKLSGKTFTYWGYDAQARRVNNPTQYYV